MRLWLTAVLALASLPGSIAHAERRSPIVAAASDLQFALEAASRQFTNETGERVTLVFGSSGTLMRQAMDGAPFELFLSADEAFVDRLADAGLTRDRGALYGIGRLVIFAPHGSPLAVDERLDGLREALARGEVRRFAIANPEHAPYGQAAEAALRTQGLWDAIRPTLVFGENISQAAQFAATGEAAGGLVAYSLALAPSLTARGRYALVSDSLHPPLRQRMVLLDRATPVAERFYQFLQAPPGRALLREFGFVVPE